MLLIYFAVILLLLSPLEILVKPLSIAVKYITYGLNFSVKTISELPFAKIQDIQFDWVEVMILFVVVLFIMFFILSKRMNYFRVAILFFLFSPLYNISSKYIQSKESCFVVYNIPKISAIDFVRNNKNQLFINTNIKSAGDFVKYNIKPFWNYYQIENPEIKQLNEEPFHYYVFNEQKIVQINNNWLTQYHPNKKLEVDYIILSENADVRIKELVRYIKSKMIIFDSSNNFYTIARWKEQSKVLGIDYYDISEQGAFILKQTGTF